jgi:immunity protein Imm1 of predicted polymorphic toxin system
VNIRLHYAYENVVGQNEPAVFDASDTDELAYHLDRLELLHGPLGLHALAEIGKADKPAALQFALDVGGETDGRAVLRWLSTGEFGIDPNTSPPDSEVAFDGSLIASAGGIMIFSATASRMSPERVKEAIHEYAETGHRPTSVEWLPGSPAMAHAAAHGFHP